MLSQLVSDDANLLCTLVYNALIAWQNLGDRRAPPHAHVQVDGVSTNWGSVTFGFMEHLVKSTQVS